MLTSFILLTHYERQNLEGAHHQSLSRFVQRWRYLGIIVKCWPLNLFMIIRHNLFPMNKAQKMRIKGHFSFSDFLGCLAQ